MSWLLLIPALMFVALVVLAVRITIERIREWRVQEYDYSPGRLRFFNLEGLDRDSNGLPLAEYRREVGNELIVWLQDDGTKVSATTVCSESLSSTSVMTRTGSHPTLRWRS